VVENQGETQIIEVEEQTEQRVLWSRYRATAQEVTPLASRMFGMTQMLHSLPWAFGGALLLYFIGRHLQRRQTAARPD
jgi:hypothetical protein